MAEWIPVTDKLPSDMNEDWVLVQIQETNGYLWIPQVAEYRKNRNDWLVVGMGIMGEDAWLSSYDGDFGVIAWQPLPDRYIPDEKHSWKIKPELLNKTIDDENDKIRKSMFSKDYPLKLNPIIDKKNGK